ncbi:hypothetical protein GCM10027294_15090 [Marinactinospora endophytica]
MPPDTRDDCEEVRHAGAVPLPAWLIPVPAESVNVPFSFSLLIDYGDSLGTGRFPTLFSPSQNTGLHYGHPLCSLATFRFRLGRLWHTTSGDTRSPAPNENPGHRTVGRCPGADAL